MKAEGEKTARIPAPAKLLRAVALVLLFLASAVPAFIRYRESPEAAALAREFAEGWGL